MAYEIKMPQLGLTMEEGTVIEWYKEEGSEIKIGDILLTIETDKLTNDIESEAEGVLLKRLAKEGETLPVQAVLGMIGAENEQVDAPAVQKAEEKTAVAEVKQKIPVKAEPVAQKTSSGRIRISPLAKKTAEKLNIDYSGIAGSGPNGRIVQSDVFAASETRAPIVASAPATMQDRSESVSLMDGDEVIPLEGMRKAIAERMIKSHLEIPTASLSMKIDVTELLNFRTKINQDQEEKLSVNDFVLKAVAKALKSHMNILVSMDGDNIIKRAHINLGMAVALEDGLIVPVIKDADKISISELSSTAKDLAEKARSGSLSQDEYKGSTITISNLGMLGVDTMTPVINQPDAAILGVCAVCNELDIDGNGDVVQKKIMKICMTIDHRLLDGAVAAHFLGDVRKLMEHPIDIIL